MAEKKKVANKNTSKKKEIEDKKISSLNSDKDLDIDDEPNWYHYVIVLLVLFGIVAISYYGYQYYDMKKNEDLSKYQPSNESFIYPYVVGNITYNIEFQNDFNFIKQQNVPIELKKEDIWSSYNVTFAFYLYNQSTDNRYISITSVKLMKLFKFVYSMNFDEAQSFKLINESNCSTSTLKAKVVVFDSNQDRNGVFYNQTNGCIQVFSKSPKEMVLVGDTLLYDLIVKK